MVRVDILVLFLIVGERLSVFPIEQDFSCGAFIYGLYDVEVCSIYPYFVEDFYQEWMLYFANAFSASIDRIIWFLSFLLLMWYIILIDLKVLNHLCSPRINPTWSCWIILWMYCWIWLLVSCWEFLHPYSSGILVYSSPF